MSGRACGGCGHAASAQARFCEDCGSALVPDAEPLRAPAPLAEKIRSERAGIEGERKQVTVLFCDIVGSMRLTRTLDDERWGMVLDRFLAIASRAVHELEGTVNQFTGDGLMAVFGAPLAHEDHARRACLAALHLQREVAAFAAELQDADGVDFAIRCGLNSGEVIVGSIGDDLNMDFVPIGNTTALGKRMETLAPNGSTAITAATAALVGGEFALAELGEFEVKGAETVQRVFELTGPGTARSRLEATASARGLSRLVGRDGQQAALEVALDGTLEGEGRAVGIVGEAGIGKSRLLHEFVATCQERELTVIRSACFAHGRLAPLLPVLGLLRSWFGIDERDAALVARGRVAGALLALDETFDADLPLLYDLLGIPDPERPAEPLDPDARRRRLVDLMTRAIAARSDREPTVMMIEDLHWIDGASATLLDAIVAALVGTRTLLVTTFRSEYTGTWMQRGPHTEIALDPLDGEAAAELIGGLLGGDPSLDGLVELIAERTGGNPFFAEELVHALAETGHLAGRKGAYRLATPIVGTAVPASVQAVLAARIDRAGVREKAVLQAAAVIGREFAVPVLERVVELKPSEIEAALQALVAGEFVDARGDDPGHYAFRHQLTRDVAYDAQLTAPRAARHAAVARALGDDDPERLDERAAIVAGHWEAAGETLDAARWHARAATWIGSSDPAEARRHWVQVRALTDAVAGDLAAGELGFVARVSLLHMGLRAGIDAGEADTLFAEADRMAVLGGEPGPRAMLFGAYAASQLANHGRCARAAELADRSMDLAEESGDPHIRLAVGFGVYPLWCVGRYHDSLALCERAIEVADGDSSVGAHTAVACPLAGMHMGKGINLIMTGALPEALRWLRQSERVAADAGDIELVGWVHEHMAWMMHFIGDPDGAMRHARESLQFAERAGGSYSRTWAWFDLGWAHCARGEWREAIDALEQALAVRERPTGADSDAWRLAVLAEAHLGLGDHDPARERAREAVALADEQGHVFAQTFTRLAQARVLRETAGVSAGPEIDAALRIAEARAEETGAVTFAPLLLVERAELARLGGDAAGHEALLRAALAQFVRIGATGHAERLSATLGVVPAPGCRSPTANPARSSPCSTPATAPNC